MALLFCRIQELLGRAGGLALGFMMIPLIMRTTEEVLLLVPNGISEASLATRHQPLANHRAYRDETASKESSPAFSSRWPGITANPRRFFSPLLAIAFRNHDLAEPIAALPLQIFSYAISPYDDSHRQASAGAPFWWSGHFFINVLVPLPDSRTGHTDRIKGMPSVKRCLLRHKPSRARAPKPNPSGDAAHFP